MSKAIEQFNAERDAELHKISEQYSQLQDKFLKESEEVKKKTEQRILAFYREHKDEIGDVLLALKEDVRQYIYTASLDAGSEPSPNERQKFQKSQEILRDDPDNEQANAALQSLFLTEDRNQFMYDAFFSDESLRSHLHTALSSYLSLLQEISPSTYQQANDLIETCIIEKKSIVFEWRNQLEVINESPSGKIIPAVRTKTPKDHITTTDKLSSRAFATDNDSIYSHRQVSLRVSPNNSKKEINTLLSIRFDELEREFQINMKRLTPFDRAVYDAIMTLYIEGGNRYMSIEMIHRIMVGNPKARVMEKQGEAIKHSVKKMMHTVIEIDVTEEEKVYKQNDYFHYTGNLLYAEMVETSLNGNVVNALHIVHEPVLYSHASRANKIGRISLKLLDTPISKNEEAIVLQDYLSRRVLTMKGSDKLSKTIVYETIYQQLDIKAGSANALWNKKRKIRENTKKILDYWQQQNFIKGYTERSHKNEKISITIQF